MISYALFMMIGLWAEVDWRTTQMLVSRRAFPPAFAEMTSERLVRAEDAYEAFILADEAQTADGIEIQ